MCRKLSQPEVLILAALKQHFALPANQLAYVVRTSNIELQKILTTLQQRQLIVANQFGAHRYFRMNEATFASIDKFMLATEAKKLKRLPGLSIDESLKNARTCYGHLAGKLGVALANKCQVDKFIVIDGGKYQLTPAGKIRFERFGALINHKQPNESADVKPCLDWTERQFHLAGSFGKALTAQLFKLKWLFQNEKDRAVIVTPLGLKGFAHEFGLTAIPGTAQHN